MPLDISTLQPHLPFGKPPLLAHKHAHTHTRTHTQTHTHTHTDTLTLSPSNLINKSHKSKRNNLILRYLCSLTIL